MRTRALLGGGGGEPGGGVGAGDRGTWGYAGPEGGQARMGNSAARAENVEDRKWVEEVQKTVRGVQVF